MCTKTKMDGTIPQNAATKAVEARVAAMAATPAWKRPVSPEAGIGTEVPGMWATLSYN